MFLFVFVCSSLCREVCSAFLRGQFGTSILAQLFTEVERVLCTSAPCRNRSGMCLPPCTTPWPCRRALRRGHEHYSALVVSLLGAPKTAH